MNKFILIFLASSILFVVAGCASHPFESQVRALLNETGVSYELKGCHGGWTAREMYCDISIKQEQIDNFASKLGLRETLPYFEGETRLIVIADNQNPAEASFRNKYRKAFGIQQWIPAKHGFASAALFYNQKTGKGCLYLSIAFG